MKQPATVWGITHLRRLRRAELFSFSPQVSFCSFRSPCRCRPFVAYPFVDFVWVYPSVCSSSDCSLRYSFWRAAFAIFDWTSWGWRGTCIVHGLEVNVEVHFDRQSLSSFHLCPATKLFVPCKAVGNSFFFWGYEFYKDMTIIILRSLTDEKEMVGCHRNKWSLRVEDRLRRSKRMIREASKLVTFIGQSASFAKWSLMRFSSTCFRACNSSEIAEGRKSTLNQKHFLLI